MLERFIKYSPARKSLFVTITNKSLVFSENVVKLFGFDSYISFWVNKDLKRIAIRKENEQDKDAIHVFGENKANHVRVSNIVVMSAIRRLMPHWTIGKKIYKVHGEYDETNQAIIFDFLNVQERIKL